MAIKCLVMRNQGHPWDENRRGFDLMAIDADTQSELDKAVAAAKLKFWQLWLAGFNTVEEVIKFDQPSAIFYKPSGILETWHDSPEQPHPGICNQEELATN